MKSFEVNLSSWKERVLEDTGYNSKDENVSGSYVARMLGLELLGTAICGAMDVYGKDCCRYVLTTNDEYGSNIVIADVTDAIESESNMDLAGCSWYMVKRFFQNKVTVDKDNVDSADGSCIVDFPKEFDCFSIPGRLIMSAEELVLEILDHNIVYRNR